MAFQSIFNSFFKDFSKKNYIVATESDTLEWGNCRKHQDCPAIFQKINFLALFPKDVDLVEKGILG